jgi:beta-galactosidase
VPRAAHAIRFSLEGPGEIVATDNGDATSFEPFASPRRHAFSGQALVIVRGRGGEMKLRAEADGLKAGTLLLRAER